MYVLDPVAMSWTNLSDAASGTPPSARRLHGFKSAGSKLYVHGGVDAQKNLLSDLYAFDPIAVAWMDLSDAGSGIPPTARDSHGFTSAGGELYVHGGCADVSCNDVLGDLHSYDPVARVWTDLSQPAGGSVPTARSNHGFTSAAGKLYVHGGQGPWDGIENPVLGDLHAFDPIAKVWTNLSDAASGIPPTARDSHGFTSADGQLYVHGGYGSTNFGYDEFLSDLHCFDPIREVWTDLSDAASGIPPTARDSHGFTSAGGELYVHGGYGLTSSGYYDDLSDLHSFDPIKKVWTDLSQPAGGAVPTGRYEHGFTCDNGTLYVHGGIDVNYNFLNDLLAFNPIANVWTDLSASVNGTAPTARTSHGFTSADGRLFVHGGQAANYILLGDLHSFDPVAKVWTDLSATVNGSAPMARYEHGFTSADGKLYVHGGFVEGVGRDSDLHVYDPVAKVWTDLSAPVKGTPPTARYSHGFTSADGQLYVHGGCTDDACLAAPANDLHVFDPVDNVWTDLSQPAGGSVPTARFRHGFASAAGKLCVHGGQGPSDGMETPLLGDLHAFDPITKVWTDLSDAATSLPTVRESHGFTSAGKRLYVHDGQGQLGTCG